MVVLITIAALVLVAAAIAGNGRITGSSSTFNPGGTTSSSGTTTTASVQISAVTATEPTFTVNWQGRALHTGNVMTAEVRAWVKGVCQNSGGQVPNDPNNQKSATQATDTTGIQEVANVSSNGSGSGQIVVTIPASTYSTGLSCQGNQAAVLYSLWGVPPDQTQVLPPSVTLRLYSGFPLEPANLLDTANVPPPSNTPYCRVPGAPDCFTF